MFGPYANIIQSLVHSRHLKIYDLSTLGIEHLIVELRVNILYQSISDIEKIKPLLILRFEPMAGCSATRIFQRASVFLRSQLTAQKLSITYESTIVVRKYSRVERVPKEKFNF